jgi:hypothetical protein
LQVAHSWKDWQGLGSLPKFDPSIVDFSVLTKIPQWMNEQIGAALVKNGTCAEINSAVLNEYRCPSEYRHARWKILALWKEMGVKFTFGTDLHAAHTVNADIAATELLLDLYGFNEDDILYIKRTDHHGEIVINMPDNKCFIFLVVYSNDEDVNKQVTLKYTTDSKDIEILGKLVGVFNPMPKFKK